MGCHKYRLIRSISDQRSVWKQIITASSSEVCELILIHKNTIHL